MGRGDQRELGSRLTVLVAHLLKWQKQPDMINAATRTFPIFDPTPAPGQLVPPPRLVNDPCHNSPIRARIADGEYCRCKVPRERKYANISVKYGASSPTHSAIASCIWLKR